jgi:ABC-type sugar transport system ATPase subunit
LGLSALLDRKPRQLSGGERQRVALARAIVRHPSAFLMDEPLSNLDAKLRVQMRTEIKRLQKQLEVTTLYVTHDQVEAMTMADQVAIMFGGRLQQFAPPAELLATPANDFVREFVGGDRGIKLLAVTPIPRDRLRPAEDGTLAPFVAADATLQEALAVMLREGSNRVVVGSNGAPSGVLTVDDIVSELSAERPAPTLGKEG